MKLSILRRVPWTCEWGRFGVTTEDLGTAGTRVDDVFCLKTSPRWEIIRGVIRLARTIARVVFALALATPALAQPCPPLAVGNPDGNYIVPGVKGDIRYSGDLGLDAYVQRNPGGRPSVVVIHGGTWSAGSRTAHVGQILDVLTRAGFNWFSIDYRLGGLHRFEDSLADIRAAVTFIRCRSRELGIDRDRLVLLGEDSGAHLAALLAAERLPGVIGAALVGGFYDLASTPAVTKDVEAAVVARASPLTHAARTPTPLLVVHGSADSEAPIEQAQRYCRSVEGAKGTCRFLEVEGASHRSENWWPSQWGYKRDVVAWLSSARPRPCRAAPASRRDHAAERHRLQRLREAEAGRVRSAHEPSPCPRSSSCTAVAGRRATRSRMSRRSSSRSLAPGWRGSPSTID